MTKRTGGEKLFNVINMAFLILISLACLYPLWHVLMASLSDPILLNSHTGGFIIPNGFTLGGYVRVFENPNVFIGLKNSVFIVVMTTFLGVFVQTMAAYALSHRGPKLNRFLLPVIIFTMYFGGGIIPFYILTQSLGLLNTYWSVILPAVISTWNLIVLRTNFMAIPESLAESAKLDGANDFIIYLFIILPLSGAVVAYVILLQAVGQWNAWFNASMFITEPSKKPLMLILREILIRSDGMNTMIQGAGTSPQQEQMDRILLKYSTTIVSVIPIVIVYPFLQRYFVKGVMVGSIKG